jgi:hypothetical protein
MEYEFLEAHAVVGHGQKWPIEQDHRDFVVSEHIEQTKKELKNAK